ncbi:guanylate-binding protein 1 [Latimeria chalumnae]|uniref:guanylate-binding protein 1 n=1 Tax=Latimeria chalumnae TaxID=7897 RepID=UPI00313C965C
MASAVSMPAPVCLIENIPSKGLLVNQTALQILSGITQPVVVVAIVGMYRTGKSYLMNKLAGKKNGFALGSTIQSHTKGIWMWCLPHPRNPNQTLVLLDTEGLGDVEKGDEKNDCWIFALAVLLSSTLVYNSMNTMSQDALSKLHFVSELTKLIKVKGDSNGNEEEEEGEDTQFVRYFPNFIWTVRDFSLLLKRDGKNITEDGYLEFALELKKGLNKDAFNYNLPRQCIRNFFPSRKCFTFVAPVSGGDIVRLEELPEAALDLVFLQQSQAFYNYVFEKSEVKKLKGGQQVTGRMFASLAKTYVETINSGLVPCLENAVISMATIENQEAVKEAMEHYQSEMNGLVHFPIGVEELSELHGKCEAEAITVFMKRSFKDDDQQHQNVLQDKVQQRYKELCKKNETVSEEACNKLLEALTAEMETKVSNGFYSTPGGYKLYTEDQEKVVREYQGRPDKGVKAEEVLRQFLVQKTVEANAVLQADKQLTDAEKKLAASKEATARLEQQKAAEEEKCKQAEQLLQDERWSHEENLRQLEKKRQEEAENMKKEMERALESKLKEQEELLNKGFQDQARMMAEEITELKEEIGSKQMEALKLLGKCVAAAMEGVCDYFDEQEDQYSRSGHSGSSGGSKSHSRKPYPPSGGGSGNHKQNTYRSGDHRQGRSREPHL